MIAGITALVILAGLMLLNREPDVSPNQSWESALKNARKLKERSTFQNYPEEYLAYLILQDKVKLGRSKLESGEFD